MNRTELEHIIKSATAIANVYEVIIIGSQSVLGAFPSAPRILLESMEADVYPPERPDLADLIDGSIGELSPFHNAFGYYAQGVGSDTAVLPNDWTARLVKIQNANTDLKVGLCLDPHDLAVSKLAAGREKDWPFVSAMLAYKMIDASTLSDRIKQTPGISSDRQNYLIRWIANHPHELVLKTQLDKDFGSPSP